MKAEKKSFFKIMDEIIRHIENIGVGVSFSAIVILVFVTVFYRYVLRSGIMWSAEIQEVLVVAMAMFGCAKAAREGGHTELTSIVGLLPRKGRVVLRTITSLLALAFLAVFLYTSIKYAMSAGNLKTIMLRIPYKYYYMFLPIGMTLNVYEFVKRIPKRILEDPKDLY